MTPIHLAILKEDILLLKQMAKYIETAGDNRVPKEKVHGLCASGPVFQNTVMMAGTPLGVAALKLNKDIFDVVLYKFAPGLDVTNAKGDNLVHLLIKYAHIHPKQLNKVLEMLRYILDWKIQTNSEEEVARKLKTKKQTRKLLMMTNKEKLNPLHFAVKRRQYDIFEYIMKNDVYHSKESSDGLFNEEVYDITDIETLRLDNDISGTDEEIIKSDYHESVLEYLVHQETENAFLFADFMRVKEVIREKWMIYRWWFMGWFIIHLICMVLLSVAAVFRSKLKEIEKSGNFTESISVNSEAIYTYAVTKNAFVTGVSVTGLVFGLLYIAMEMTRKFLFRFQFQSSSNCLTRITRHLSSPYSNLIFRIYFILFSLLLISDCILAAIHGSDFISGYENYCLIFAIIIGWYLVMFFLQTIKPFSFFTVLIQRVVLDMMKFAFVMTFFLLAFSIAMFMIMQGANTDDDDFKYFGKTIVKMLTIMLGIGELGILFQARHPVLAILVFVLFVLLTTILLLNALIAMMSNSCTDLMNNYGGNAAAELHCRLQKLSVILFLEGFFPRIFCKEVGVKKRNLRYDNNEWVRDKQRRIWTKSSVQEQSGKNSENIYNILQHSLKELLVRSRVEDLEPETTQKVTQNNKVYPASNEYEPDKQTDVIAMETDHGDQYKHRYEEAIASEVQEVKDDSADTQ